MDGEDASKVKEVMVKEKLSWRTFVDRGAIADKWKPAGAPSFYILDPKGVIRQKWAGAPVAEIIRATRRLASPNAVAAGDGGRGRPIRPRCVGLWLIGQ